MEVKHNLTLCLTSPRGADIDAVQGDGARTLVCRLMSGALPWIVPNGVTAGISYELPGSEPGYYDTLRDGTPACTIEDNVVSTVLDPVLTAQPGQVKISLILREGEKQVATFPMCLRVSGMPGLGHTDNWDPPVDGFAGKIYFGGEGGALIPLGVGHGIEIEQQEDGTLRLVAEGFDGVLGQIENAAERSEEASGQAASWSEMASAAQGSAWDAANQAETSAQDAQAAAENAGASRDTAVRAVGEAQSAAGRSESAAGRAEAAAQRAENAQETVSSAVDSHNTNLAAHPYFHGRINDLEDRLNTALNSAVFHIPQTLTAEQRRTARDNIGAGQAIVCEAEGEVITLSDSADDMLRGMRIYGKTTQDGTPTPDAPVELVSAGASGSIGVTVVGKNLIDPEGITTAGNTNIYAWRETGKILPAGTYTMQYVKSPDKLLNGIYVRKHKSNETIKAAYGVNVLTFELDKTTSVWLDFYMANGLPSLEADSIMLEFGPMATEYEPYKGQVLTALTPNGLPGIPVTSGGNYTDDNGQEWVCDEVDYKRGVYVQRVEKVSSPVHIVTRTNTKEYHCAAQSPTVAGGRGFCNITNTYAWNGTDSVHFYVGSKGVNVFTPIDFDAEANTIEALCLLATPIETPLSAEEIAAFRALHTNYPSTTIWSDAGAGMEVEYVADTKAYIDNKFNDLAAALVRNT